MGNMFHQIRVMGVNYYDVHDTAALKKLFALTSGAMPGENETIETEFDSCINWPRYASISCINWPRCVSQ